MNEIFAAEPTCFHNSEELRGLLKQFGPGTGRYLAAYPPSWSSIVIKRMLKHVGNVVLAGEIGPLQEHRIKTLLQRAIEEHRVIAADLPYVWNDKPWLEHALKLLGRDLTAIVAAEAVANQNVFTLGTLNIDPVAEECMETKPQEFARVAKTLVSISKELIFVDPYANPCRKDVYDVLCAIFKLIARSGCTSVVVYARESELLKNHTDKDLQAMMALLRKESGLPIRCNLELRLVNDKYSPSKLGARFLFSREGGIAFEKGFARRPGNEKEPVRPMGKPTLVDAIQCFIDSTESFKWRSVFSRADLSL